MSFDSDTEVELDPRVIDDTSKPLYAGSNEYMSFAIDDVPHYPLLDQLVELICAETRNSDKAWFRTFILFFLVKTASTMRTSVRLSKTCFPVNCYIWALAESGYGKGHAMTLIEEHVTNRFERRFDREVLPLIAEESLWKLASEYAAISQQTEQQEFEALKKEYISKGPLPHVFDSGSREGIRQVREKILMADIGSINFQMDEVGSNMTGGDNENIFKMFLELYDHGRIKQKVIKSSSENTRSEDRPGFTPSNGCFFGTPSTVFDGSSTERAFYQLFEAGYARRTFAAWGVNPNPLAITEQTANSLYDSQRDPQMADTLEKISLHLARLADPTYRNWIVELPRDVEIESLLYMKSCKLRAELFPQDSIIERAEMTHRFSKALKIAGAFAFLDEAQEMTMDHYYQAIKLAEDSGRALKKMLARQPNYARLARHIADKGTELTIPELQEKLPFFKIGDVQRKDMMRQAIAWGLRNNVVIRRGMIDDGIETFIGEKLKPTNVNEIQISVSKHEAYDYVSGLVPFKDFAMLSELQEDHFVTHAFKNGHRSNQNHVPGFNLLVLDVDGGIPLKVAHELLEGYSFATYTTKSHTESANRYRILMPTSHMLKLSIEDYKAFMDSVFEWLPFPMPTDQTSNQAAKKWLINHDAQWHIETEGALFDVLPHLPRTSKNEAHQKSMEALGNLDNIERWFAQRIGNGTKGNRNVELHNYARMLIDAGHTYTAIEDALIRFNAKLPNGLEEDELRASILITVMKKIHAKAT